MRLTRRQLATIRDMNLVLDIAVSADFWRKIYPADRAPSSRYREAPNACVNDAISIASLAPTWLTPTFLEPLGGRVGILVFNDSDRRKSRQHISYSWKGRIPECSFYALSENVYIAAPAFIFLVAASLLSTTQLIAFGCELCGLYSFDQRQERGFRKRSVALLDVEQLGRYLEASEGCRGHKKALSALPHIIDRSASPMETFDYMAMCLPYRLGGYGLEKPLMNLKVPLSPRAARIAKRHTCYPDMCYPDIKLDIEHHGKFDHSNPKDKASDRARVNALKEMGFEVVELTRDQVGDVQAFEYIVQRIAKLLGKRLKKEALGPTETRLSFRREVGSWNQSYGRLR